MLETPAQCLFFHSDASLFVQVLETPAHEMFFSHRSEVMNEASTRNPANLREGESGDGSIHMLLQ
jgi:hypothetical protein